MTQDEARERGMKDPRCLYLSSVFLVIQVGNAEEYMHVIKDPYYWEQHQSVVERWLKTRAGWQQFFI